MSVSPEAFRNRLNGIPVVDPDYYDASTRRDAVCAVLSQVRYRDWTFEIRGCDQIRVTFDGIDADTGERIKLNGRWWYVSPHAVPSEIVQTGFLAVKTAEEHEMRERFSYRGVAVFGPHFDLDALADNPPRKAYRK